MRYSFSYSLSATSVSCAARSAAKKIGGIQSIQIKTLTVVDKREMVNEDLNEEEVAGLAPGTRIVIPNNEQTKTSSRKNGIVKAYAANTNKGLVRGYNEDRVAIILNINT